MPRRRKGRHAAYQQVKIDQSLFERGQHLSLSKGETLGDYWSDLLRAAMEKDWQEFIQRQAREAKKGGTA